MKGYVCHHAAGAGPPGGARRKWWGMLHFSCDLCGKDLTDNADGRYVVHMEVFPAHDPAELTDADLGDDHLEEVGQLLREAEEDDLEPAPAYTKLRYD